MEMKRYAKQLSAFALFLVGCFLLLASLRRLIYISHVLAIDSRGLMLWRLIGILLLPALGVYCFCSGLRLLNPLFIKKPRFGWGRIIVGSFVLDVQVGSLFHFVPNGPLPTFKGFKSGAGGDNERCRHSFVPCLHIPDYSRRPGWICKTPVG